MGGKNMATPILVTGAAGRVGAVGRTVTELLLKQGKAVRAMARNEDQRAQALRDMGAEVVTGDLLDIPVEPWRDGLLERGLPVHLVNHLATMADLHRAGRYDRMSEDVRTLTGQRPLSLEEFVRKNAAAFTASAKEG
jgi:nucleoside-diphosphate-sugar epimerase